MPESHLDTRGSSSVKADEATSAGNFSWARRGLKAPAAAEFAPTPVCGTGPRAAGPGGQRARSQPCSSLGRHLMALRNRVPAHLGKTGGQNCLCQKFWGPALRGAGWRRDSCQHRRGMLAPARDAGPGAAVPGAWQLRFGLRSHLGHSVAEQGLPATGQSWRFSPQKHFPCSVLRSEGKGGQAARAAQQQASPAPVPCKAPMKFSAPVARPCCLLTAHCPNPGSLQAAVVGTGGIFPIFHPKARGGWGDAVPKQSLGTARGAAPHCGARCGQGPALNSPNAAVKLSSTALNPAALAWLQLAEQAGSGVRVRAASESQGLSCSREKRRRNGAHKS